MCCCDCGFFLDFSADGPIDNYISIGKHQYIYIYYLFFLDSSEDEPIDDYISIGKHKYKISVRKATFETVLSHCRISGGDILQLNTEEKNIAITEVLSGKV